jgi:transposase-like protein
MDSRRQRLLERIAKTPRQPGSLARRYGNELKRDIADYALERWAEGVTQREIAAELGLSMQMLSKWMRHARRQRDAGQEPFASTKRKPVVWPVQIQNNRWKWRFPRSRSVMEFGEHDLNQVNCLRSSRRWTHGQEAPSWP